MRSAQVALLTLVEVVGMAVGGIGASTAAPREGTVTLAGLPAGAHVYVDGKAARPRKGAVRLAPGMHELQVEALDAQKPGRVVATRQTVEVRASESTTLEVRLLPVYFLKDDPRPSFGPGPAGLPGRPARGFAAPPDLLTQLRLVKEGIAELLDDLDRRMEFVQMMRHHAPTFYCLAPAEGELKLASPPFLSALLGPQGPAGIPGDLILIQDAEGRSVFEAATARLGLVRIERAVNTAASRALGKPFIPWGIHIHARELREALNRQLGRRVRLPAVPGRRGPAGPTDAVPPEARPPRLGPEEVAALLTRLEEDADLKARIDALQRRIEDR